jgi:3D (Asp-Asp-Asp) domain-containing protein
MFKAFGVLTMCILIFSGIGFDQHTKIRTGDAASVNPQSSDPPGYTCSDGWRTTGYFTPIETDYSSKAVREIEVRGAGKMSFDVDFLRVVFDESRGFGEGWGKTRFGWYLGNYNDAWHKSDAPLDANNAALLTNSVAVDNSLVPNDSKLRIPGLPGANGTITYIANDVGVTVHGKHIDIYTGEGKAAERAMYEVTFEDEDHLQRVCVQIPEPARSGAL